MSETAVGSRSLRIEGTLSGTSPQPQPSVEGTTSETTQASRSWRGEGTKPVTPRPMQKIECIVSFLRGEPPVEHKGRPSTSEDCSPQMLVMELQLHPYLQLPQTRELF